MNYGNNNGETGHMSTAAKQGGKDFVLEVCRESIRNRCKRPESQCRYAHPPPNIQVIDGKVQCCADFLKGRCFRVKPPCRYFHPPAHLAVELVSSGDLGSLRAFPAAGPVDNMSNAYASPKLPAEMYGGGGGGGSIGGASGGGGSGGGGRQCERMEVCRDFLRSRCQRDDCRFAHPPDHVAVDLNNFVIVCIDFLNGRCSRASCRYFHPPSHLAKSKSSSSADVCRDFLVGRCNRSNCKYVHSMEAKIADSKQRPDPNSVCKDFLNGKCNRTVCRFYHPPMSADGATTSGPGETAAGLQPESSTRKRPYVDDSYAGCGDGVSVNVQAAVLYPSQEIYDVPSKRAFTDQ